jgi:hypothetical protein
VDKVDLQRHMTTELPPMEETTALTAMIAQLKREMGSKGLDEVRVEKIKQIMQEYASNKSDWEQYALFSKDRYLNINLL